MAPAVSASLLFHRKKDAKKDANDRAPSPRKATPRPKVQVEPEDDIKLPDGPFQEFRLMSSALNGWKYDVMKFDSRKPVDISTWQTPIKLNRKEPRREDAGANGPPEAVGPMLGPDGKPVIGADGRMVMVDAEGRPIHNVPSGGWGGDAKGKGSAGANGNKRFHKKTRQVFLASETTRQLRREERYPWVMEDSSQKEVWVGKLEEVSRSETHAFFMPAANDVFKFVPAHRWYKFQKKPNYHIPSLEEAETIVGVFSDFYRMCVFTRSQFVWNRWQSTRRIRIPSAGYYIIGMEKPPRLPRPPSSRLNLKVAFSLVGVRRSSTLPGRVWRPGAES